SRARDDGVSSEAQSVARIRVETGLCGLLPRTARRFRARQHYQRARDRSAQAGRRGTESAAPAGVGPERYLVRPQGPSVVLSGTPELAGQSGAGEADLADVPGACVR